MIGLPFLAPLKFCFVYTDQTDFESIKRLVRSSTFFYVPYHQREYHLYNLLGIQNYPNTLRNCNTVPLLKFEHVQVKIFYKNKIKVGRPTCN